jgi:anti-anti-sigma factor
MSLTIQMETKRPGFWFVSLNGRIDQTTAEECDEKISSILLPETRAIVFDMTGLNYISSMGLRIVLKTRRFMSGQGGAVYMMNVQPQIEKVFEIANLLQGMRLFADTKEADEYFDAIQKSVLESST